MSNRMSELVGLLNEANRAYEQEHRQIMSDFEYDKLYDELLALEAAAGAALEDSPTRRAGHEILSNLVKVRHDVPLLSLDKTKEIAKLQAFLEAGAGVLSWKLDGLTVVLKYSRGRLVQATTRGNGVFGEDVTHNARFFSNIPKEIDFLGEIAIRGEAIISLTEFERINEALSIDTKYKNPRNLCSGTIRQLDSRVAAVRNVEYYPFALLEGPDFELKSQGLQFLEKIGFQVAEYKIVDEASVAERVEDFKRAVNSLNFATDGLVLTYDNVEFGRNLGVTSKFPRDSIAFKWADELVRTNLRAIEWSTSRTGLINPVAVFEPVEIEGTTVERAGLHNISIAEALALGIGDEISVYKANMIIPQIAENFTKSGFGGVPAACPVCSGATLIKEESATKTLNCTNPNCRARVVAKIAHYASRDALNIEGLAVQTIEKFNELGFLENFADLYNLGKYEQEIVSLKGFGEKSFTNLINSIEKSKQAELPNFIFGMGIDNVGLAGAKLLCKHFGYDFERIRRAEAAVLELIEGFGPIIAGSVSNFFQDNENNKIIDKALQYLTFAEVPAEKPAENHAISGKTFVITGDLEHFDNRKELQALIESQGGKVAGSVSKKTDYLINNDSASTSSKNAKAKELGVTIITEAEFLEIEKFN